MADGCSSSLNISDGHNHQDTHIRRISAGNPNTPEQILARLSEDRAHHVRRRVAENQRTPVEVLRRLAMDVHSDIRLAVAENKAVPPDVLVLLASDSCADVRYGVAENPHMPEDILFRLAEDENPYVCCRALRTLQNMAPDVQERINARLHSVEQKKSARAANQ